MKEYKCIKSFNLPIADEDGDLTEADMTVENNTFWFIPENEEFRFIGGEVRLESGDSEWIEISNEIFKECFEEIAS